jgi:hypothetical protein
MILQTAKSQVKVFLGAMRKDMVFLYETDKLDSPTSVVKIPVTSILTHYEERQRNGQTLKVVNFNPYVSFNSFLVVDSRYNGMQWLVEMQRMQCEMGYHLICGWLDTIPDQKLLHYIRNYDVEVFYLRFFTGNMKIYVGTEKYREFRFVFTLFVAYCLFRKLKKNFFHYVCAYLFIIFLKK